MRTLLNIEIFKKVYPTLKHDHADGRCMRFVICSLRQMFLKIIYFWNINIGASNASFLLKICLSAKVMLAEKTRITTRFNLTELVRWVFFSDYSLAEGKFIRRFLVKKNTDI